MNASRNVPSVWPGYVAAIASLVLSLLLLLAILVFALTQVGNIVSAYMQEILRQSLLEEQAKPKVDSKLMHEQTQTAVHRIRPQPPIKPPEPIPEPAQETVSPDTPLRQIRLIFAPDLSEIPPSQQAEVVTSIKQIQAPSDATWLIWGSVLATDTLMERSVYRLMLSVRKTLIAQGVPEKQIELQLKPTHVLPPRYQQGEIIIHAAPLHLRSPSKGQP